MLQVSIFLRWLREGFFGEVSGMVGSEVCGTIALEGFGIGVRV